MIVYNPTDGDAFTTTIRSAPKRCFLMTRLGRPVPEMVKAIRTDFSRYLEGLSNQAAHYEIVADQLDRNPILAIDYLKRAYLITGDKRFRTKAKTILKEAGIEIRAKNNVELLAAAF